MGMSKTLYLSLNDVYDAERKVLTRAVCDDMGRIYMNGICAMVAQIESDLLDAKSGETEQDDE